MSEGEKILKMMNEVEALDKKIEEVSKKRAQLLEKLNKAKEAFEKKNAQLKELQLKKDAMAAGMLLKAAADKKMSLDDVLGLIEKEEAV